MITGTELDFFRMLPVRYYESRLRRISINSENETEIQYSQYFIAATSYLARDSNLNPRSTSKVIVARTFWGQ